MDRYDGDWEKDIKHGKGVSTEHADAEPIKFHVEYCNGKLKVKKRMALSEELPRELSYKDNDVTVFVGMPLDPNTPHCSWHSSILLLYRSTTARFPLA